MQRPENELGIAEKWKQSLHPGRECEQIAALASVSPLDGTWFTEEDTKRGSW